MYAAHVPRIRKLLSDIVGSRLATTFALAIAVSVAAFASAIILQPPLQYLALLVAITAGIFVATVGAAGFARIGRVEHPRSTSSASRMFDATLDTANARTHRRWSEPWLRPFPPAGDGETRAVLLPGAAYHLAEIAPLAEELECRGYSPIICVGEAHWSRTQPGLFWLDRPTYEVPSPEQLEGVSVVITMKDWAGYKATVDTAKSMGILTVAIVEGVQDFDDLHQPVQHRPYQTADLVLCQGDNDVAALGGRPTAIVGSNRLEQLVRSPTTPPVSRLALINVNFTYGVLTDQRDAWVQSAVYACDAAATPYILSIHPAAKVPSSWVNTTRLPISSLLPHASVLISRFSTVPFEAMARGVRFIYHNPHGERMPVFQNAADAFDVTSNSAELTAALRSPESGGTSSEATKAFFARQVSIVDGVTPAQRSADAIDAHLAKHRR